MWYLDKSYILIITMWGHLKWDLKVTGLAGVNIYQVNEGSKILKDS